LVLALSGLVTPVLASPQTVTICHRPPGNPEDVQTITVNSNAVQPHLAHGDTIGPCAPPTDTVRLTVTKVIVGSSPHSPEQFTICVDSIDQSTGLRTPATPPCAPGSSSGFIYTIKPGQIESRELLPPDGFNDYQVSQDCGGIITEDRTCSFINTYAPQPP
jgi:hypothetical protein